ncbi:transglycosylase domain-containing protein [Texcoconibacillus texcoconensis]|uniref:1A family penicillin-binding protein n=1 Tax=Texcoconibacillus texcoconensis TaxID=1095777 RepID=A0A840QRY9_9BACI|nr:PBP1A family penicillin-binding protein [Texcoconibacillus texcoconensis]MBB5174125.1 1A family penicillin-binding protein [Texcoconibacillus texcoconensis]
MEVLTRRAYRRKRRFLRRTIRFALLVTVLIMAAIASILTYAYVQEPPPLTVSESSVVYSSNDEVIGEYHLNENRRWVSLDDIDDSVIQATLAVEDRKFFEHTGFDITGIARAGLTNVMSGSITQGASTITQQYARNLFLTHDQTWVRKWNEAMYALRLEMNYSKKEILEGYLNTIYYGNGAYGIEAAANEYFGKSAKDLSVSEAALLVGIPRGPSIYSPFIDEERAKHRQHTVLKRMDEEGYITEKERYEYQEQSLSYAHSEGVENDGIAPHFQDTVYQTLVNTYGIDPEKLQSGGLEVHTTIDTDMQRKAEEWVRKEIPEDSQLESALLALDPRNGKVRAMVGSKDYQESQFNRTTQALRQPGSTFKPMLYAAALENGLNPASMLKSEETTFLYDEGREDYSPGNFGDSYADDFITMQQALAVSDNIYAMKTHFFLGFDTLADIAERFGISTPLATNPSLALGTGQVSMIDMVNSYSPFANKGNKPEPIMIEKVINSDGEILVENEPESKSVIDADIAYVMTDMLTGMFNNDLSADYASVTGRSVRHLIERPVAGKSGSTSTDSWMIGYTPQLLGGVWVGYDEKDKLKYEDTQHAKRIWAQFIEDALSEELTLPFSKPDGIIEVDINPETGRLATEDCPVQHTTAFIEGTEPSIYCTKHLGDKDEEEQDNYRQEKRDREKHKKERFMDKLKKWFEGSS